MIWLRIGSEGREPVWAEWPLIYHREVPADAIVKWAKVHRERLPYTHPKSTRRDRWSLLLTVEIQDPQAMSPTVGGMVALDLRWSKAPCGGLRAGGWSDDGAVTHDIMLPPEVRSGIEKAESLRAIRDQAMTPVIAELAAWLRSREDLDEEWARRTKALHAWRSAGRLGALVAWWEGHRLSGDEEVYAAAVAWYKHDRHLWQWESCQRERSLRRRREGYRVLGTDLARRYDVLVIERIDLSAPKLSQLPDPRHVPDVEDWQSQRGRSQRVECAPSELRQAVLEAFVSRGRQVLTVSPRGPAAELWRGVRERFEDVRELATARGGMSRRQRRMRGMGSDVVTADTAPLANERVTDDR